MLASDLRLVELLDFLPDQGRIELKGHRMLLWNADAFGNLRKELIENLGVDAARGILRRFGFANGYRDATSTRELFDWPSEREWWLTCPALQGHQGKVSATVDSLVVDKAAGSFAMAVTWRESYEAAQHVRVVGPSPVPVCWTLAGYASGFASAVMGEEVFVVEETCQAMGHDRCRVVGKTRREWGESDGDRLAAEYDAPALARALEARDVELARTAHRLERSERELHRLTGGDRDGIVTRSREMERVLELVTRVAAVDATVLVTGESGVGKERIARMLHAASPRAGGELVAVNCGALPETLLESELFGYVKGAFTGAASDRRGLFEAAGGGTIFLDEIGETSAATQVKLLRVLQEREVRRVGATASTPVDVRVIAATNRNLAEMVAAGTFRADLYYRLKVVTIDVPPLRQRRGDILPLARHFVERARTRYRLPDKALSPEVATLLAAYAWPGNVRELEHAIEHAVVLSGTTGKLDVAHLPPEVRGDGAADLTRLPAEVMPLDQMTRRYTLMVLERNRGSRIATARALGIGANTLWRWLKRWGVSAEDVDPEAMAVD